MAAGVVAPELLGGALPGHEPAPHPEHPVPPGDARAGAEEQRGDEEDRPGGCGSGPPIHSRGERSRLLSLPEGIALGLHMEGAGEAEEAGRRGGRGEEERPPLQRPPASSSPSVLCAWLNGFNQWTKATYLTLLGD